MGGVVAADLTCEYQRRQQDLVYTEADDQHLKASSFTTFTPPCLRHILLPALPIRPVTEPLGSKSKAVGPKPDPASLGVQPAGELLGSGAAIRIIVGRAGHPLVGADGRGYARRRQAAARRHRACPRWSPASSRRRDAGLPLQQCVAVMDVSRAHARRA